MMSTADILLLSMALAMDCFTVSTVSGILLRRWQWGTACSMAILFGLFQALMPLGGWTVSQWAADYVASVGHVIAFVLLSAIGGRMVWEALHPGEQQFFNPESLRTQLLLAVATSIDALAIGVSMAFTGYRTPGSLVFPLSAIGVGSLVFSLAGFALGVGWGETIKKRMRPELLGGLILILIGVKVLLS